MNRFYKQLLFITLGVAVVLAGGLSIRAVNNRGNDPVGWWKFDEGYASTTYDAGTGDNDGTLTGGVEWQNEPECKTGKCLYFDGDDDYVNVGNTSADIQTITFWLRPASTTDGVMELVNNTNSISIASSAITTAGFTSPTIYVNGIQATAIALNSWNFVAITTSSAITAASVVIGEANGDFTDGYIDDVKIYDYARSAAQIKADYVASAGGRGGGVKVGSSQESQDASEGLVAYWTFDETALNACGSANDACDASGNNNHLSMINDASPTSTAKYGYAATFDGTGDYLCSDPDDDGSCEDDDDLDMGTSDFTIEAWVNLVDDDNHQYIIDDGQGGEAANRYIIAANTSDKLSVYNGGSWFVTSNTSIKDGSWHHIVVSRSSGVVSLYVDGVFDSSASNAADWTNSSSFFLGARGDAGDYFVNGQIDDVKIYKTARSASQIRKDYETGPPPYAHYTFDEGGGDTVYDIAGNFNGDLGGSGVTCPGAVKCPTWRKGGCKYGGCLEFIPSNDDYIQLTTLGTGASRSFTYEAWAKPDSDLGGNKVLVYSNDYYRMLYQYQGNWRFVWKDADENQTIKTFVSVTVGDWQHMAVTYNPAEGFKFYKNGILVNTASFSGEFWDAFPPDVIGGKGNGDWIFDGMIDDVRIYNYARTQRQIMEDMNAGHPAVGSPVGSYVGYWKFDEGYGQTLYDSSIYANNFTLATTTNPDGCDPSWTTDGKFNHALEFDGVDDYIYLSDDTEFQDLNEGTISMWLYPTAASDIFFYYPDGSSSYTDYLRMRLTDDGNFQYTQEVGDSLVIDITSDNAAALNAWHHIVVTQDGSTSKMYINGVLQTDTDSGEWINDSISNGVIKIGDDAWGSLEFAGKMDELKIYPFALTPEEVLIEYNNGSSLVLGSKGTPPTGGAGAGTSTDSASIEYCVPGDTDQCDPPIGRWKLDEKSGITAYDSSGNGNDGTLSNGPVWKSAGHCKKGACLEFDGSDDEILVPHDSIFDFGSTGSFTVCAWANSRTTTADTHIVADKRDANEGGWSMYFHPTNDLFYWLFDEGDVEGGDSEFVAPSGFKDNKWHFACGVVDRTANYHYFYVDGVLQGSDDISDVGDISTNDPLGIGRTDDNTDEMDGFIDDVTIYNYARTPAQIAWEYNRGKPVGHWTMDSVGYADDERSTVYDASENSNDGTYYNEMMNNGTTTASTRPTWKKARDCRYGSCLSFDGTNDYINCGGDSSLKIAGSVSVAGWFYFTESKSSYLINNYENNKHYLLHADADGSGVTVQLHIDDNSSPAQAATGELDLNTWYHIVGVRDSGSTVKLYVNGVEENSVEDTAGDITSTENLVIGARALAPSQENFNGYMDEIRVYNTALSAAQVEALYLNNDRAVGASLEDNLVGEWRFDEGAGDNMADTHYQREGKLNYAMNFDGTNDFIDMGDLFYSNTLTVSAWIYVQTEGTAKGIVVKRNNAGTVTAGESNEWHLYTSSGNITFSAWDGVADVVSVTGKGAISQNTWTHVLATCDGSNAYVYVDGVLVDSGSQSGTIIDTDDSIQIGVRSNNDNNRYFDGLIDDVRVYNYSLTAEQVLNVYNEGAASFGPSSGLP